MYVVRLNIKKKGPVTYIWYDNEFNLSKNDDYKGLDSLCIKKYENGSIKSKCKYAITRKKELSDLKIGECVEYYPNGRIKSKGRYKIGRYIDCGVGGPERAYYNYKYGLWIYYSIYGAITASGKYAVGKYHLRTRCEDGDTLRFGIVTKDWHFQNSKPALKAYESIVDTDEYGSVTTLFYNRSNNQLSVEDTVIKNYFHKP